MARDVSVTQPIASADQLLNARIRAIDLLRGLVILIMALDHVRDFWSVAPFAPEDLSQTSVGFFFTRWITHFCAPVFVLLSGTSAYLYALKRQASRLELARFLSTRGLWLILVELTWVSFSWQFGLDALILQVIWAIGWSMLILAGLIFLPRPWILFIALLALFGHNLLDGFDAQQWGEWSWFGLFWHQQGFYPTPALANSGLGLQGLFFGYPLLPWFAVMALGYLLGPWFTFTPELRSRYLTRLGLAMVLGFILLRGLNGYGNPTPWQMDERGWLWSLLAILNTQKYPPSLHYLLMTLGPALILLPRLESWSGRLSRWLTVFGKVPFFFYMLHLPLIHITAVLYQQWRFGAVVNGFIPPNDFPPLYTPSLLTCYLAWLATIFVLYWPCRWFVGVRQRYSYWWLSYL